MLNLILFVGSAALQIIFISIVYFASKGSGSGESQVKLRRSFYSLSSAVVAWSLVQYSFDWSTDPAYQEMVIRLGISLTIVVASLFVWFAMNIAQYQLTAKSRLLLIWIVALSCLFSFFADVADVAFVSGEVITTYNWWLYSLLTALPIVLFGYGIYLLEKDAKKIKYLDPIRSKQDTIVSRGMILTALFAFFGNFVFSFLPVGQQVSGVFTAIAPAMFTLVTGYTVFSLKLFNFRKFFFRVIIYGLVFSFAYLVVGGFIMFSISKVIDSELSLQVVTLLLGLILYPIAQSFTKEIFNTIGRGSYDVNTNLQKRLDVIFRNLNTKDMLNETTQALADAYGVDRVVISVNGPEFNDEIALADYPGSNPFNEKQLIAISQLTKLHSEKQIIPIESIERSGIKGFSVGFVIIRDSFTGTILIGQRLNGRVIYDDERANLAKVSNEIALALENTLQYTRIQQFNAELEKKIEDATGKLQKSNEKLKALDEAKDEFISMASHQLRTPLTSVKGYISMILEGDAGQVTEQQRLFLDQAFISSQRMVYLIADLLNVSRLKTGKFIIEAKPTYLPDVIESEISQLYETAKSRELKLVFNKPDEFPTLNLDEVKIRQVIMNFTDNAIYYTPKGGKITLDLTVSKGTVEFKVQDTGIGVPKSEQHHLFTKFYRAGNAKKARPDGTGLGLFMAKKVVVAQGGAILFSTEEGKGSTFGFTFPLAKLETPVA